MATDSRIQGIIKLMKAYPDSPHKRKILTSLGDLNEQLNSFLFGIASTQGYEFDTETFKKVLK